MSEERLILAFFCGGLTLASSACGEGSTSGVGTSAGPTTSVRGGTTGSTKIVAQVTTAPTVSATVSAGPQPCGPLGKEQTIEDVRAHAKSAERDDGKIPPHKLTESECGDVHVMSIHNGYGGWTYYLRDGKVIGSTTSTDYGAGSCSGEIPDCSKAKK